VTEAASARAASTIVMSDSAQWNVRLAIDAFAAIEPEIGQFLSRVGVEGAAAYTSQLVVEEIVRNLIEHTPPYATDEMVDVAIAVTAQRVTVVIEDRRPPFDPSNAPPLDVDAPLERRQPGGMGLHLVRTMADELTYETGSDGNRLTAIISRR